jgi:RimJ/RimL family protein N-acetyltransferase
MTDPARPRHVDPELFAAPPSISMRLARPDDAAYIYGLRVDPALNPHLSAPPPSVEAQRVYLERYRLREDAGQEFYFVIDSKRTGRPCGVVRIYDLQPQSLSWGSWILDASKPRLAALESALFVYDFAFGLLGYGACHFEVRRENTGVISFHRRFGAEVSSEDEANLYFHLGIDALREKLPGLIATSGYTPLRLRA